MIFQQDGCGPHRGKSLSTFSEAEVFELLQCPAQSPNLNPIENDWAMQYCNLRQHSTYPTWEGDLFTPLSEVCDSLLIVNFEKLIESRPNIEKEVQEFLFKFELFPYWQLNLPEEIEKFWQLRDLERYDVENCFASRGTINSWLKHANNNLLLRYSAEIQWLLYGEKISEQFKNSSIWFKCSRNLRRSFADWNSVTFCKWKCLSWLILISNRPEKKIQGHFLYAKCYLSSAKTRLRTLGLQSHSKVNVNYHYFGLKPVLDGFPGVTNKLKSWLAWNQPNFARNFVFRYLLYPKRIGAIIWTASRLSNLRNCKDSVVLLENTH